MAPEQLSGQEVTARSDLYALGLVLYEIFTGQRALEASNLAELIHWREQSGIPPATAIVKSLDPKIERVIAKCLKPEADERPVSALAVAGALPGGDPLAAARGRRNAVTRDGGGCGKSRRPFASRDDGCRRVDCPLAPCGRVVVSARDPPQPRAAAEAARGLAGSRAGGARVARVRPNRRGRHCIGTGALARLRAVHRGDVHCARSVEPPSHRAARDILSLVPHQSYPARSMGNRVPGRPSESADDHRRHDARHDRRHRTVVGVSLGPESAVWTRLRIPRIGTPFSPPPGCSPVSSPRPSPRSRRPTTPTSGARGRTAARSS